jgi:carboxypeptidase Q
MMLRPKSLALLCAAALAPCLALRAQEPATAPKAAIATPKLTSPKADAAQTPQSATAKPDDVKKIIDEGMQHSKVMETLSYMTDVIGPRLTGSPNLKRANDWTREKLAGWGLEHAHLEAWGPFGRGWTLKSFSAQVVEPQCIPLIAYPKAWSPGTDGKITAEVVYLDVKTDADFAKYKGKLKGKIVLMSPAVPVPAHFEAAGSRMTDKDLLALADAPPPGEGGQRPRRLQPPPAAAAVPGQPAPAPAAAPLADRMAEFRALAQVAGKKLAFALEEGAVAALDVSRTGDGGTLFVSQASVPGAGGMGGGGGAPGARGPSVYAKDAPKNLPQITVAKEHYNRMIRMINQGEALKISLDLAVEFQDNDLMAYNTIAEIPGTDLKDEIVMLGGHLDSWHSGTGATDNAAGVSCCMEAVRIIKALDLKPRRTIRIGLWTGEEEGLLGSRAYVKEHFGEGPARGGMGMGPGGPPAGGPTTLVKKPDYDKFAGYFNLDNGTGKVRGVYLQGNEAVRPIFREWLGPFREMGAATLTISNTGGTDHQSFDGIGLPGFQFIQDEIEYDTRTHHSNQDVFDRIQADDMKQASVILAAFVYQTANRDEKLPHKPQAPARPRAAAAAGE